MNRWRAGCAFAPLACDHQFGWVGKRVSTSNCGKSYDLDLRRTFMRPAMSKLTNSPPARQGNISRGETWLVWSLLVTVCTLICIGGRSWNANALVVERTRLNATWSTPEISNSGSEDAHRVFLDVEIKNKTGTSTLDKAEGDDQVQFFAEAHGVWFTRSDYPYGRRNDYSARELRPVLQAGKNSERLRPTSARKRRSTHHL